MRLSILNCSNLNGSKPLYNQSAHQAANSKNTEKLFKIIRAKNTRDRTDIRNGMSCCKKWYRSHTEEKRLELLMTYLNTLQSKEHKSLSLSSLSRNDFPLLTALTSTKSSILPKTTVLESTENTCSLQRGRIASLPISPPCLLQRDLLSPINTVPLSVHNKFLEDIKDTPLPLLGNYPYKSLQLQIFTIHNSILTLNENLEKITASLALNFNNNDHDTKKKLLTKINELTQNKKNLNHFLFMLNEEHFKVNNAKYAFPVQHNLSSVPLEKLPLALKSVSLEKLQLLHIEMEIKIEKLPYVRIEDKIEKKTDHEDRQDINWRERNVINIHIFEIQAEIDRRSAHSAEQKTLINFF